LEGVHPSYDLATIRPDDFRPRVGGMDFLPDGRLLVCTWDADGAVYVLDGVRSNQNKPVTVKRIAAGLAEPLGLKVVGKRIFVLQKQELTELVDLNGDDVTDEYRAIANGWGVTDNFHEFAFGLAYKDGHFYANLATAINPGGSSTRPQNPDRGKAIKIAMDGSYEFMAHGLRTPNGVGLGYHGDVFLTDNQGDWLPASKLLHLTPNAFFGNRAVNPEGTATMKEKPPVVWLPQGEIGNSPSTPLALNDGPYRNQMVIGDVTYGGLQRVYVEEVGKQYQGAVFRMTQGLEAGINRIAWGPDGALYVGGIGSTGNWGQNGKERFGLQRLKYNGKPTFEMLAVRVKTNGFEIEFTEPLMAGNGEDASSYFVDQFRYQPTEQYGGPKLDETVLPVKSVTLSPDRKRAFLELDGLKTGHVVHLRLDSGVRGQSGRSLWSTETWYTLNAIPQNNLGKVERNPRTQLSAEERRQGFAPLFDGASTDAWIGYRKDRLPRGWKAMDGTFTYDPKAGDGGDIMTKEEYGDFELRLDWKVSPGGNSGVFFRVDDKLDIPWYTGPEMQVLDNDRHPDGKNPKTSAGANYAMHATDMGAVNPAGQWNEIRLIVRGDKVEHWLNGKRVVAYTLWTPEWEALWKASKFASLTEYGRRKVGHLVLQDHGDAVWFRNIRIKRL
jgi:cytochrome c